MNSSFDTSTLKDQLLAPLYDALAQCPYSRACPSISDLDWLLAGVQRSLDTFTSGRDFLQKIGMLASGITTYFDSLKSARRCKLAKDISFRVEAKLRENTTDIIAENIPELDGYDVWAGDGHWHSHATHDRKIKEKYYATGHLYGLNLRHGGLHHLQTSDQTSKLKEHDISGLKRLSDDELRVHAPKGRKVIWIWDKAGINFHQWFQWKNRSGIYFISLEKENMKLDELAVPLTFDRSSQINEGVTADELCGTSQHVMVRRVTYIDPASGKTFKFITSIATSEVPPGAIAQLYRMRWDIEKVFDDVKNKFKEQKAWATSEVAKTTQAELICITYNLTRRLETLVQEKYGIENIAENERRAKRMAQLKKTVTDQGKRLPLLYEKLVRATQISSKFIRWIRYMVWKEHSDDAALDELRSIYAKL